MRQRWPLVAFFVVGIGVMGWAWWVSPAWHAPGAFWGKTKAQPDIVADGGLQTWDNSSRLLTIKDYRQCGTEPCGGGTGTPDTRTITQVQGDPPGMVFGGSADFVWDLKCFQVTFSKVDETHYRAESVNRCNRDLKDVYILVKFLDSDGARVGVDQWQAHYVAKGERLRHEFPSPAGIGAWSKVAVRKISDDPGDNGK